VENVHRPAPGEPGSETWPKGDQWKNGGGSVWVTPNYDSETNLLFVGTGNGGPWIGDRRPGDTSTPHRRLRSTPQPEIKDTTNTIPTNPGMGMRCPPPILVDFKRGSRTYKGLIDAGRDGYLCFLERSSGKIILSMAGPSSIKRLQEHRS